MTIRFKDWLNGLSPLTGADLADGDRRVIYDADADNMKRVDHSEDFPTFHGAIVNKVADETGADYSGAGAPIPWDAEHEDTDGFHDTSTNNERLTVPASFAGFVVRVDVNVIINAHTSGEWLRANIQWFDSSDVQYGEVWTGQTQTDIGAQRLSFGTRPIRVSSEDYFRVNLQVQTDTSITVDKDSSFSIDVTNR